MFTPFILVYNHLKMFLKKLNKNVQHFWVHLNEKVRIKKLFKKL